MSTVLLVDDQNSNRELVRDILTYRGHRVIEAHEGAEALGLAHAEHPDLILTDVLMPGMDGYQLAQELRAADDTANTPIVFLTANYLPAEAEPFAEACGIARVLLKSADPQTLLHAVEQALAESPEAHAATDPDEANRVQQQVVAAKLFERTAALSETTARFQLMADHSPVGTVSGDRHGAAHYVNSRFATIMGLPEDDLLGRGWLRCVTEDQHGEILAVAAGRTGSGIRHHYRGQIHLPDESSRWLNVHVQNIPNADERSYGFIATIDDVTAVVEAEQRQRADERRHDVGARIEATQRLEGLSRLAGGVAHDFNNILSAMLGFETLLEEGIDDLVERDRLAAEDGRMLLDDLSHIRKGGRRATELTQQLLTFGSRKQISVAALDLNQAIRESNELLAPTVDDRIEIATHLAADLRPVLAEPVNIGQILLHITMNAFEAMPAAGTLTVVTSNADIGQDESAAGGPAPGPYVRMTIQDTGEGMTPEVLERALEPFFTTKPKQNGRGLGLATTYGVVNQLGGTLRIESAPRRGTTVTIHLPATDRRVERPAVPAEEIEGGTETVLVVDDEDGVREVAVRCLAKAGYTVLSAADGPAAIDLLHARSGPIHLLLSDVVMPKMHGTELAAIVGAERPGTPVLFMSGYADGLMNDRGVLPDDITVLPKPFTMNELLAAVRTAIATATGQPA